MSLAASLHKSKREQTCWTQQSSKKPQQSGEQTPPLKGGAIYFCMIVFIWIHFCMTGRQTNGRNSINIPLIRRLRLKQIQGTFFVPLLCFSVCSIPCLYSCLPTELCLDLAPRPPHQLAANKCNKRCRCRKVQQLCFLCMQGIVCCRVFVLICVCVWVCDVCTQRYSQEEQSRAGSKKKEK